MSLPHPVEIAIHSPRRFDRLQLLVRLVIAIALGFLGVTAGWTACALYLILPAVAAAYISARGPAAYLADVAPALGRVIGWLVAFHAYMLMAVDRPQTGDGAGVRVAIRTGGHPSVPDALLRLVTSLPAALLLALLLVPASIFALLGVLTVLVAGAQAEPLLRYQRMVIGYAGRLAAYHADLVAEYPSFTSDRAGPGTIDLAASAGTSA
ncbi:MAG TPA: DUF4389 domain-containing protein [Kofleriaceae bacterium]|nr:DUF4389 domain-containing protein [Kofleriaceae bacterium]